MTNASTVHSEIFLWEGSAPQSHGDTPQDKPTLRAFLPKKIKRRSPAVVIFPGGGYGMLSLTYEGTNVAQWFQNRGVAAFVLKYRLPVHGYRHPVPLLDAKRALRYIRAHAANWNIHPSRIGAVGFSAGGHLAATLETHFDAGNDLASDPVDQVGCRPDFVLLVYPVISMQDGITSPWSKKNLLGTYPDPVLVKKLSTETQVTSHTPPTVLVHAGDDGVVPIQNSHLMYAALQKAGVPSALHEYPQGGHGFGLGYEPDPSPHNWLEHACAWFTGQGLKL